MILAVVGVAVTLFFFVGATQVSAEFLTGVLTFDGIMIAAIAITLARSDSPSDLGFEILSLGPVLLFILSSLLVLYMLLRLEPSPSGLYFPASDVISPVVYMLAFTILGIFLWGYFLVLRYAYWGSHSR